MIGYIFYLRVHDPVLVLEERRQVTTADITVFVDGTGENLATMLAKPWRVVSASSEEGDAEWGLANYHDPSLTARDSGIKLP